MAWSSANRKLILTLPAGLIVARGGASYPAAAIGRPLYDYMSLANMLQPCAAHSPVGRRCRRSDSVERSDAPVRRIDAARWPSTAM